MGGFLTIGYCFLEIFVGEQNLDKGGQSCDGDPPVLPLKKTLLYVVEI